MKIASWNIRGCNKPLKQQELKRFLLQNKIDVLGVLESRIKRGNFLKFQKKFRALKVVSNHSSHYNGRILVMWNTNAVEVTIVEESPQSLNCLIKSYNSGFQCNWTFVYAFNTKEMRRSLWLDLQQKATFVNGPWLLVGDFNVVLNVSERISFADPPYADIDEFVNCVQGAQIHDIPGTEGLYTWCNKQEGDSRIQCKLDRAMGNAA